MIKHFFYLQKETADQMQLKIKSRGFKKVSAYVRSLVENDLKSISNKQSMEFSS